MEPDEDPMRFITTSHEIGLVTAARLVAIFWAGLLPVIFPAWIIVKAEIATQNREQDDRASLRFVTRAEFEEWKVDMVRRFDDLTRHLETIQKNQQKVLVKLKVEPN